MTIARRAFLSILAACLPAWAFAKAPPGSDPKSARALWFAKQTNMVGGVCCQLGDGHELAPGDVRYSEVTGLWSVRLPDPSVSTYGTTLDKPTTQPKRWVEIVPDKMRDPAGGPPPIGDPIIWYDTGGMGPGAFYSIYCFEPNVQF